jgi:hypothetical protein
MEVLWQLRRSPEARRHNPGIAGLDRALRRARWQSRAGIGWFFRYLWPVYASVGRGERNHRALLNAILLNASRLENLEQRIVEVGGSAGGLAGSAPGTEASDRVLAMRVPPEIDGMDLDHLRSRSPLALHFAEKAH